MRCKGKQPGFCLCRLPVWRQQCRLALWGHAHRTGRGRSSRRPGRTQAVLMTLQRSQSAADRGNEVITRPQLSFFAKTPPSHLFVLLLVSSPLISLRFFFPTTLNLQICFFPLAKPPRQNSIRPLPFPEGETIHLPLLALFCTRVSHFCLLTKKQKQKQIKTLAVSLQQAKEGEFLWAAKPAPPSLHPHPQNEPGYKLEDHGPLRVVVFICEANSHINKRHGSHKQMLLFCF